VQAAAEKQPVDRLHAHRRLAVLHDDEHAALPRRRREQEVVAPRRAEAVLRLAVVARELQRHAGQLPGQRAGVAAVLGDVVLEQQHAGAPGFHGGALPVAEREEVHQVQRVEREALGARRAVLRPVRREEERGQVRDGHVAVVEHLELVVEQHQLVRRLGVALGGGERARVLEAQHVGVGTVGLVGEARLDELGRALRIAAVEGLLRRRDALLPGAGAARTAREQHREKRVARDAAHRPASP